MAWYEDEIIAWRASRPRRLYGGHVPEAAGPATEGVAPGASGGGSNPAGIGSTKRKGASAGKSARKADVTPNRRRPRRVDRATIAAHETEAA